MQTLAQQMFGVMTFVMVVELVASVAMLGGASHVWSMKILTA